MKHQSPSLDDYFPSIKNKTEVISFQESGVLRQLKHYLPAQSSLKDFIHHNTLHSFQSEDFHGATLKASGIFGYKTSLSIRRYRELYLEKRIRNDVLEQIISQQKGARDKDVWLDMLLKKPFPETKSPRIGKLRSTWNKVYGIDLDAYVHPLLFRVLGAFLDQGISMWKFPISNKGFLSSLRELEQNSMSSFFKTRRARTLLLQPDISLSQLLKIITGHEVLYETYLFDQQFAHAGWSGMISVIDDNPDNLLDSRNISLREVIIFELLVELDALDYLLSKKWEPLSCHLNPLEQEKLFSPVQATKEHEILSLWQDAFEWSYYDDVLAGIRQEKKEEIRYPRKTFQAMFCIDDRECSIRRHLENSDPCCETFGTPGFFGVEFFYKPEHGKSYTKLCPAPVEPRYLVKETGSRKKNTRDVHFSKHTHSLFRGWLITNTLGFWSALKLFFQIFRPTDSPATAASFKHMDELATLTVKYMGKTENGLQVGFTKDEMVKRVEDQLLSIGMTKDFAPLVYVVGHGSSSVNNPHYAAYDCGACSGRPGSVNARVLSKMANNAEVREELKNRGIVIPDTTQFVGALHDTTRDEIVFYDTRLLLPENIGAHKKNVKTFHRALTKNAKERSRRFETINTRFSAKGIHQKIKRRSVSLFEPRPELNHATNAVCIIGRRELSKRIFLDRRSFLNSYDFRVDPHGNHLLSILQAAAPVCGGINLEYFFSRVDPLKLGAGTKLPHNVIGLFAVANGTDGDLRPGLPTQMTEVHDPVRLLIIVEHHPSVVLSTIRKDERTYEWFAKSWIHLVVTDPVTGELHVFRNGEFIPYRPLQTNIESVADLMPLIESDKENFPVYLID